jgi:hypothetical protein
LDCKDLLLNIGYISRCDNLSFNDLVIQLLQKLVLEMALRVVILADYPRLLVQIAMNLLKKGEHLYRFLLHGLLGLITGKGTFQGMELPL